MRIVIGNAVFYIFLSQRLFCLFFLADERCDAPLRRVSERLSGRPDTGANVGRDAARNKVPMGERRRREVGV